MKKIAFLFMMFALFCVASCQKKSVKVTLLFDSNQKEVEIKKGTTVKELHEKLVSENTYQKYEVFGYFEDEAFTKAVNDNTSIKEAKTLYVYVNKNVFDVTIISKYEETKIEVALGEQVYSNYNFERDGVNFVGVYTNKEMTSKYDISSTVSSDLTLYARYEAIKHTVTFNSMGGTEIKSQKVEHGSSATMPQNEPMILNGSFVGWYIDSALTTSFDFSTKVVEDITLYAKYEAISYDGIIDQYLPDVITSSLTLPQSTDTLEFTWSSSDPYTLSSAGIVIAASSEKIIEVSLDIYPKGSMDFVTYKKTVTVEPYELKELEVGSVVIGYTSSWNYLPYTTNILDTVTILDLSFAYVNANGTLDMSSLQSMMSSAVSSAHEKGVRVMLSIQGYGENTKNFSDCAASPVLRKTLAEQMAYAVEKYHLDGIDIDWEYPGSYSGRGGSADRTNYTYLMKEIREALNKLGSGYLLTAAIPAGPWGAGNFEMAKLTEYFDFFNMMSYDLENPQIGSHHAALYPSATINGTSTGCSIAESVKLWNNAGVPSEKICLGMAFYGKRIMVKSSYNGGLGQVRYSQTVSYKTITYQKLMENYLERFAQKAKYNFDLSSLEPTIIDEAGNMFSTYDNEASIIEKCMYATSNGLGGVMIWEIGEDHTDTLIKACAQGMNISKEERVICVGTIQRKVGCVLTILAEKEIQESVLLNDYEFVTDSENVELSNQTCTLLKAGTAKIKIINKETKVVLHTLTIEII